MIEKDIEQAKLEEEAEKLSTISDKPKSSSRHVNTRHSTDEFRASELTKTSHIMGKDDHSPLYRDIKVNAELPRKAKQKNSSGTNMGRNEENYWHLHQADNPSEVRYTTHQKHPMDQDHPDEKETLILLAETIGTSVRKGFEMPKRDCLMCDGNPMNYPRFIENFKTNIEKRAQSPRVRLAYLIQFCTGVAKEAISNCVMLSEDKKYLKAREILPNSFGQNHINICADRSTDQIFADNCQRWNKAENWGRSCVSS